MTRACARTYMFTSLSTPTRLADGFGSKVNPIIAASSMTRLTRRLIHPTRLVPPLLKFKASLNEPKRKEDAFAKIRRQQSYSQNAVC